MLIRPVFYATWQSVLRTVLDKIGNSVLNSILCLVPLYEGWNFNSGNYLFTTDTK